ncbi:MAG: lysoplasmalogenase [Anaerolineales bacterium]|nr:lysoplasmalogenase [Anaerolineales bacterium]
MIYTLVLTLIFAALDWLAVTIWRKWKILEYIAKPLTLVTLTVGFALVTRLEGIALWFGLGLLLSLAGDIFLMLPREQFIAGLVAFLLAHVAYIIGLTAGMTALPTLWAGMLIIVLGVGLTRVMKPIIGGLKAKGLTRLVMPVQVYGLVITAMLFTAMLTVYRVEWNASAAALVSAGAFLFYLSDIILAWHRFVNPIKNGRVMNMVTYHLGQMLLATGVIFQVVM